MTKKQQQIVAVAVLAIIAIVAGGYLFAVKPKMAERKANQEAAALATTEAEGLKSQLAELQTKFDNLPQATAKVDQLTSMFPNTFEQDQWFNTMRAAAARTGVTLTQITPGIPTAAGATDPATGAAPAPAPDPNAPAAAAGGEFLVAESAISLNATGTNAALANFLTALENLERPLLVDTVTISFGTGEAKNEGTLAITGKTFLTRPMDPPPAIVTGTSGDTETPTETSTETGAETPVETGVVSGE